MLADPVALQPERSRISPSWVKQKQPDLVLGAEARGFMARRRDRRSRPASASFRRGGPGSCRRRPSARRYFLEYGENSLEVHPDLIPEGARVVIHDDVLATGGTVEAIAGLVERLGGVVVGACFIIELDVPRRPRAPLGGRLARADRRMRWH